MGLIERIKSALGLRSSGSESQSRATTGDGSSPSRDSATESDRDDIETGRETETGVETETGADTEDERANGQDSGDSSRHGRLPTGRNQLPMSTVRARV